MMNVQAALDGITADATRGDFVFPTHAGIALRVQRLLDAPDCALDTLTRLIAAEPVLAARVLGLANAAAYNPGGRRIDDLKQATTRIGFSALRALAAALVVRQMEQLSPLESHRALAATLWKHTAHVAALARVIARRVTGQNPDLAFFAGIVHEIGSFYLIARASEFPELLTSDLEVLHGDGEARIGHAVLKALDVPSSVLEAMDTLWSGYLAMPPHSLGDTLLLANEITPLESPLDVLTGMSRKGMSAEIELLIDDDTLSHILAESADEVASLCAVLSS